MYEVISHVRNEEKTLPRTLASVQQQTIPPSNIYFIDDGSSDKTNKILHENNITHLHMHQDKDTPSYIRRARCFNRLIEQTREPYLLKVDGDVLLTPGYAEKLLTHIIDPEIAAASGQGSLYDKTRDLNNGAVMYQRDVLPVAREMYGWDLDIQLRLIRRGYRVIVDTETYYSDLRPPTVMKPSISRVIYNRVNRQISELIGAIRR